MDVTGKRGTSIGHGTLHDLLAADADLARLVPAQRRAGVRVDDHELGVADDGAAGA